MGILHKNHVGNRVVWQENGIQEHKDWIIYLRYPAKIFIKKHEDEVPVEYKWEANV